MRKVTFIVGPTASGKTSYSIELAKRTDAEIISADSMQIYKYMDIGTAKPDEAERDGIPHHMIDIVEPDENFSVAQYREMALERIREITARGKGVIVAGGTGLYVNSLIYNVTYSENSYDPEVRAELEHIIRNRGNEYLHARLGIIDPIAALNIHVNDKKRIVRAMEIYLTTGCNVSDQIALSRESPPDFEYEVIGMETDRQVLYQRIEKRVDNMLEAGLLEEVNRLCEMGFTCGTAMQAIGYKEMTGALHGKYSIEDAVIKIKMESRRYAKRQLTWLRRDESVKWLMVDG